MAKSIGALRAVVAAFLTLASTCSTSVLAQSGDSSAKPPAYKQLRYDEDYAYLQDQSQRSDPWDLIKYIPLGNGGVSYLSIGGEIRQRYEYFRNPVWGQEEQDDNGYWLQRYMLHTDVHLGNRVRFFGQIKSGIEIGRAGGPRGADEDQLDLHQAFVDIRAWADGKDSLALRIGRQEIGLGSSRLVSFREGPNVRQSFDGVRLGWRGGEWQIDGLATKPVETKRGFFDDAWDHTRSFWGVYAVGPFRALPKGRVDLYYLGLDRKKARFDQGIGRELRHSIGARIWGQTESWDYNTELVYQWGSFGQGSIRAWTTASDTGYRIESIKFRPRFGLKADIASGDRDPTDGTLGTFNALFPKGAYFSEADLLGPYNLMDLHPSLQLNFTERISLIPDGDFFWRQSTRDGVYGIPGNLIRSGHTSSARYIGSHSGLQLEWRLDRHITLTTIYLHFFPGPFLKETQPGRNVNFVALWVTYRF
jgi:alginate export protein